ncbi:endonuclease domain-containing protein [Variovorax sp. tm]|uniref:endonuclease domain-containing protein n=1 Tax=Variovorax atrisoli TaxID=3394203 RepID=UPI003A810E22
MDAAKKKTIWRRLGLIAVLLPVCIFFPFVLIIAGWVAWTIYEDFQTSTIVEVPPPRIWKDASLKDEDWLTFFCTGCESPAEEAFVRAMVEEYDLQPNNGKLCAPGLTLEMQVELRNYRYDFIVNGKQIVEVDGATYHSSPEQVERDRVRDEISVELGYRVLRIPASIVFVIPKEAVRRVQAALSAAPIAS